MKTTVPKLAGFQRKYLRGLAHSQKPILLIGQKGVTDNVTSVLDEALSFHELVKVKFIEDGAKENKHQLADLLQAAVKAELVGMIGHTAIFYRQQADPEKRKIVLPSRKSA